MAGPAAMLILRPAETEVETVASGAHDGEMDGHGYN